MITIKTVLYQQNLIQPLIEAHYPPAGILLQPSDLPFVRYTNILFIKLFCKYHKPCVEEAKKIFAFPGFYKQ